MRSRPFLLIAAATVLAAFVFTVAYHWGGQANGPRAERKKVAVIFKMTDNSFWLSVADGVTTAAKDFDLDVTIDAPRDETMINAQIAMLRAAIAAKPAAIILAASDYRLLVPSAHEAKERGIPLVCVDSFIESEDADVKIGTDNVEAGKRCGEAIVRLLPPGSQVAIMSYVKGSSTAMGREEGAISVLKDSMSLLGTLYSGSESSTAFLQAKALLMQHPHLGGIAALNQPTVEGAARALVALGLEGKVALIGVDNSFEILKDVERGVIHDTIVQKPFTMGYLAVKAARDLIDGKHPPRYINTGSVDVTRHNMFQPENQKLLFPVTGGS
ncbi:MAG: substrate-binding domain-containing protein [Treponema sp.]|nr:substrate-binding domain-containing protein [Treponema sp.]